MENGRLQLRYVGKEVCFCAFVYVYTDAERRREEAVYELWICVCKARVHMRGWSHAHAREGAARAHIKDARAGWRTWIPGTRSGTSWRTKNIFI